MNNSGEKHPFIAHTPTMRIPKSIKGTDNVYRAMFAMLLAVRKHNKKSGTRKIQSVACPGLGTFYGAMDYNESARLMGTNTFFFLCLHLFSFSLQEIP